MTTVRDENAQKRAELFAQLGLSLEATFVPQSGSRNRDKKDPSLNWAIKIRRKGTPPDVMHDAYPGLMVDYTQGIAHIPTYPRHFEKTIFGQEAKKAFHSTAETGKYPKRISESSGRVIDTAKLPDPRLDDVLSSILMDADAIDYTFDEWCSNLGYSNDSISAKRTYDECVQTAVRLRQMLKDSEINALREVFQDY